MPHSQNSTNADDRTQTGGQHSASDGVPPPLRSRALVEGHSRAPARAMLKAAGFNEEDLAKPIIAVANTWTEIGPCNMHLRKLAECVKKGIRSSGGTTYQLYRICY